MFALDPILQRDCIVLGNFPLSLLLLMNDANYPWFILVPQREEVSEIYQLSGEDQQALTTESSRLARTLAEAFGADKMNIAALGNVVRQLHVHHVVRYRHDAAWPAPIWGRTASIPYSHEDIARIRDTLKKCLPREFRFNE